MLEYTNDNLLTKALLDNGVTSSGTYTAADEKAIDMAAADIYLVLCAHPDFKEGSRFVTYTKGALMALRRELLKKHGMQTATIGVPVDSRYQKPW